MTDYLKAKELLIAAKCPTCHGLGTVNDAELGDISFNTKPCEACETHGLTKSLHAVIRDNDLLDALRWALEYIDAIPSDVAACFPTMPGFDRDYVNGVIDERLH